MKRLLTAALVLGSAAPAWAHATFSSPATGKVAAGTTVALAMEVPHERGDTDHNSRVDVVVPDGWTATACTAQAGWTCTAKATVSGRPAVTWTKSDATPGQDETFRWSAKAAGTAGDYAFKVLQTYQDGVVKRWIGGPGSDEPAPVLTVTGSAAASPTAAPTAAPTAVPTATPTAAATTAPPAAAVTPSAGPTAAGATASAGVTATASPTTEATASPTGQPTLVAEAPADAPEDGPNLLVRGLLLLGIAAVVTAVVLAVRARRTPRA